MTRLRFKIRLKADRGRRTENKSAGSTCSVIDVRLLSQLHGSEVKQLDVTVVLASGDTATVSIVGITCAPNHENEGGKDGACDNDDENEVEEQDNYDDW